MSDYGFSLTLDFSYKDEYGKIRVSENPHSSIICGVSCSSSKSNNRARLHSFVVFKNWEFYLKTIQKA